MASPLVIPGVQVRTLFEPSPVLPGATGILGVVGVADRGPVDPTPIGNMGEFLELFGQASRFTMPEVRTALANGVSQVVVARLAAGTGAKASIRLKDEEGEEVAILRARAEGIWGNLVSVRVTRVRPASGRGVKYVNLDVYYAGILIESFNRLVMDEESPDYFFDRINDGSRVLVALDPEFEDARPGPMAKTAFTSAAAAAATAKLKAGVGEIALTAKRTGRTGNRIGIAVRDAAGLLLVDAADAPSIDLRRRDDVAGAVTVTIVAPTPPATTSTMKVFVGGAEVSSDTFDTVDGLITKLQNNSAVVAVKRGNTIPKPVLSAALTRRTDIDVVTEGQETRTYPIAAAADIAGISDSAVQFGAANALPDAQSVRMAGGRGQGPALLLKAPDAADDAPPLLELHARVRHRLRRLGADRRLERRHHHRHPRLPRGRPDRSADSADDGSGRPALHRERARGIAEPASPRSLRPPARRYVPRGDRASARVGRGARSVGRRLPGRARPAGDGRGGRPGDRLGRQPARRRRRALGAPGGRRPLHEDGRRRAQPHRPRLHHASPRRRT